MAKAEPSTQEFVPIQDIKENVVVLKNGQLNMVLLASSINFALKSRDSQAAILQQFQAFLNTLDFSIQFYVQSRRLNIEPYLEMLKAQEDKQHNDLMRIQLQEYMQFVRTFTDEVDVMSKNFFVIVPYTPVSPDIQSNIKELFGGKKRVYYDAAHFTEHKIQLEQRVALVEQGLNRVGVRTIPLKEEELVELYYHIFNPEEVTRSAPEHNRR